MKEGDELIIIKINAKKDIKLYIIGLARERIKKIKKKLNNDKTFNNNQKRDMLLIDDSIMKFGPIDVPTIIAYLFFDYC